MKGYFVNIERTRGRERKTKTKWINQMTFFKLLLMTQNDLVIGRILFAQYRANEELTQIHWQPRIWYRKWCSVMWFCICEFNYLQFVEIVQLVALWKHKSSCIKLKFHKETTANHFGWETIVLVNRNSLEFHVNWWHRMV